MTDGVNAAGVRQDGRAERWREHRERRRTEFVDAALVALRRHGPEVNITEIAATAGVAKPKLYRHFEDRADLFDAVAERLSAAVWSRLSAVLDPTAAPAHLVREGLRAYLGVVAEHPDAFRVLLRQTSGRVIDDGRRLTGTLAALIAGRLRALGAATDAADPAAHALAGAVCGATLWWLEQGAVDREALIEHLATITIGALEAILRASGVRADLDRPVTVP